jgi:single-strand DNA-binding protein
MLNHVVLRGVLSRPSATQVLQSESVLVRLEVRTRPGDGPAETVPVVWFDPPSWATELQAGAEVVVVGRVRRRFYRAGPATQSRTEVVADSVIDAASRRKARRALSEAAARLEAAAGELP